MFLLSFVFSSFSPSKITTKNKKQKHKNTPQGGTVGDIESAPFVEALRQFHYRVGADNFCSVHVSLVPVLGVVGEQKTKPTQHSVSVLRSLGIAPNFLACRSEAPLEPAVRDKLALFCQVPASHVLTMHDVKNIWRVPLLLQSQGAHEAICACLGLPGAASMGKKESFFFFFERKIESRGLKRNRKKKTHTFFSLSLLFDPPISFSPPPVKKKKTDADLTHWRTTLADRWDALSQSVSIAVIGKYTGLSDAYLSVIKALQHACLAANRRLDLQWVEAEKLEPRPRGTGGGEGAKKEAAEENGGGEPSSSSNASSGPGGDGKAANGGDSAAWATLEKADGILVPGGFGGRGVEGKILAAGYARTAKKPYLGICLGMQVRKEGGEREREKRRERKKEREKERREKRERERDRKKKLENSQN